MFEQKLAFSLVFFCSHAAISLWFLLFFRFFRSDFFLNSFPNPFIVHSGPIFFILTKLTFLASCFLFTYGILILILFFLNFLLWVFFRNGFPSAHIDHSRSNFLFSHWKLFELYVRTCPAMFFVSLSNALFRFTFVHTAKLSQIFSITSSSHQRHLRAWRHF